MADIKEEIKDGEEQDQDILINDNVNNNNDNNIGKKRPREIDTDEKINEPPNKKIKKINKITPNHNNTQTPLQINTKQETKLTENEYKLEDTIVISSDNELNTSEDELLNEALSQIPNNRKLIESNTTSDPAFDAMIDKMFDDIIQGNSLSTNNTPIITPKIIKKTQIPKSENNIYSLKEKKTLDIRKVIKNENVFINLNKAKLKIDGCINDNMDINIKYWFETYLVTLVVMFLEYYFLKHFNLEKYINIMFVLTNIFYIIYICCCYWIQFTNKAELCYWFICYQLKCHKFIKRKLKINHAYLYLKPYINCVVWKLIRKKIENDDNIKECNIDDGRDSCWVSVES